MLPTDITKDSKKNTECLRFVLHEKNAAGIQHVLRLEKEGVLKCWLMPEGFPESPKEKCIAVDMEDCETNMLYFTGLMPRVHKEPAEFTIDDSGKYETLLWSDLKKEFILKGSKNSGRYILVKFEKAGPRTWIIMKAD